MISTEQLDRFFVVADGLPHPRWADVTTYVNNVAEDQRRDAGVIVLKDWLSRLARAISHDATVFMAGNLLLLASSSTDRGEDLLAYGLKTQARIRELLRGLAEPEDEWPLVVLVFADVEQFYDYINHYHVDDGEYGGAGGLFVTSGYPHIVVGPGEQWRRHAIIAHELTHDYLFERQLPLWLDEGLAQIVEEVSVGAPRFLLDRTMRDRHRAFWSEHGLEEFWSGDGFEKPGEIQQLVYELALVLLRNVCSQYRERVGEFVRQAKWQDAGESAALQVLGQSLASLAADFLGEGEWSPGDYSIESADGGGRQSSSQEKRPQRTLAASRSPSRSEHGSARSV